MTPYSQIVEIVKKEILETVFPIGSQYITQTDTNPSSILGFGTWERLKATLAIGLDENKEDFNEIGKTGGEDKHKITIDEMPSHSHRMGLRGTNLNADGGYIMIGWAGSASGEIHTEKIGNGQSMKIWSPYKVVGYVWLRTA